MALTKGSAHTHRSSIFPRPSKRTTMTMSFGFSALQNLPSSFNSATVRREESRFASDKPFSACESCTLKSKKSILLLPDHHEDFDLATRTERLTGKHKAGQWFLMMFLHSASGDDSQENIKVG
jgi:hypothetical protein